MTGLALVVFICSFVVALTAECQLGSSQRKFNESFECRTLIFREPIELRREKLRTRVQLWTDTRIVAAFLAAISGVYLMWVYFIQPTLPTGNF